MKVQYTESYSIQHLHFQSYSYKPTLWFQDFWLPISKKCIFAFCNTLHKSIKGNYLCNIDFFLAFQI